MPPQPRGGRGRARTTPLDAEHLLLELSKEAARLGYSLLRVPPGKLPAATSAAQEIHALGDALGLSDFLAERAKLSTAILQLHAMGLRDHPLDADGHLAPLLSALAELVKTARKSGSAAHKGLASSLSAAMLRADAFPALARAMAAQRRRLHDVCADPTSSGAAKRSAAASAAQLLCHMDGVAFWVMPSRSHVASAEAGPLRARVQEAWSSLRASSLVEHAVWLRMELQAAQQRQAPHQADIRDLDVADIALTTTFSILSTLPFTGSQWVPFPAGDFSHRCLDCILAFTEQEQAQLSGLVRQPGVQLYVGWLLAGHLSAQAGVPLFGLPPSLMPVGQAGLSREALGSALCGASAVFYHALAPQVASAAAPPAAPTPAVAALAAMPYRPVHVIRMLCQALELELVTRAPANVNGMYTDAVSVVSLACYRALLCPMPLVEAAEGLRALWPHVVRWLQRGDSPRLVAVASRLLRLTLPGEEGGAGGGGAADASYADADAGARVPLSLRCALEAGLLPAVTQRIHGCRPPSKRDDAVQFVATIVDLLLRHSGVWPALLAFASAGEVTALVEALGQTANAAYARENTMRRVWRHLLAALLEQTGAVLRGVGFSYGQPQSAASSRGGGPCSGGPGGGGASRSGGATGSGSGSGSGSSGGGAAGSGGASSSAGGASGLRAVRGLAARSCQRLMLNSVASRDDVDFGDGPAMRAPPDLALIARLGGCPPAGSAAEQRQRKAAMTAAAHWLPLVVGRMLQPLEAPLMFPVHEGAQGRVALYWVEVMIADTLHRSWAAAAAAPAPAAFAAAAVAAAAAPAGRGSQLGATVMLGINGVLAYVERASSAVGEWQSARRAQLPACFDVLEAMVAAQAATVVTLMKEVALRTSTNVGPGQFQLAWLPATVPSESFNAALAGPRTAALKQQHSRHGLLAALKQLYVVARLDEELPPGWQPPTELLMEAPHLVPPECGGAPAGFVPLPSPF